MHRRGPVVIGAVVVQKVILTNEFDEDARCRFLKSQVGLLQTAHSWANAVLLSILPLLVASRKPRGSGSCMSSDEAGQSRSWNARVS